MPVGAGWCRSGPVGAGLGRLVPVPTGTDRCRCRGETARNAVLEIISYFYSKRWTNLDFFVSECKELSKIGFSSNDFELMRNSLSIYLILEGLRVSNLNTDNFFQSNVIQDIMSEISMLLPSSIKI